MLETPDAVASADEIVPVPGVDMVMVGPHDLTAEMGILGQFGDQSFLDAVRAVAKACRAHDTIRHRRSATSSSSPSSWSWGRSAGTDVGFMTEAASAHAAAPAHHPGDGGPRGGSIHMSTPIHTEQVHDPMAWVGSDFAGDEELVYHLQPRTVAGLEEVPAAGRSVPAT